jgi:glycerate 2-kinase
MAIRTLACWVDKMGMHAVLNRSRLIDHGPTRLRADSVDMIEHAIRAADPYEATKRLVRLEGELLRIGGLQYDLRLWEKIYLLGAGKATQGIAVALEEILGERLSDGVVILKRGEPNRLKTTRVVYASHPVPDEGSLQGARLLVELARKAGERDLVISAITGGSSALAVLPPDGITLSDKQILNERLLASGASIREINAVRKHVSQIKGGRLALAAFPAELVVLTVSDVVGDPLDYITDLTVPDTSSYLDAWNTLDKYHLWHQLPPSICDYLRRGIQTESPKSFDGRYHPFIVVGGDAAYRGAVDRCIELGYSTTLIQQEIEGESRVQAGNIVSQAEGLFGESSKDKACALIGRGETIVTIEGVCGEGGPNQEFVLAAALAIQDHAGIAAASIDMDGTDGPTVFSGGIVDGGTIKRAGQRGYDAAGSLKNHASRDFLEAAGDLVFTGPTGTNVNDLMFVLMDRRKNPSACFENSQLP